MRIVKSSSTNVIYLPLLFTLLVFVGCNGCQNKTQRVIKPHENESVKILRFESELFAIQPQNPERALQTLAATYGSFYQSYAKDVLSMPEDSTDPYFTKPMTMLLQYKPLKDLAFTVDSVFTDLSDLEAQLGYAMGVYKQEFPGKPIPKFLTFISEFGYANITYDSLICIGLDMYMNNRFIDYYRAYEFPEFMIRKLSRPYIVPNAIKALAIREYEHQTTKDRRFLSMMIHEGKVRYFTKALLPDVHDSIIMGYTAAQLQWSQENEPQMWTHFIQKNLLFQNEPSQFMRYFTDGPFTSADGVPAESSPMIGTWAGLQIVRKYMDQHPEVSLRELMENTNVDLILKESKYRPE